MSWVLDCSFTSALFLPSENSNNVNDFFATLKQKVKPIVPLLWWYETANVLAVSENRKKLSHPDIVKLISLFKIFGLQTDYLYGSAFTKEIYELAHHYNISAYDAVYLELAIRKSAALASLDKRLLDAAAHSRISTFTIK